MTSPRAPHHTSQSLPKVKRGLRLSALSIVITVGLIISSAGVSFAYLALATNMGVNQLRAPQVHVSLIENNQEVTTPTATMTLGSDTKQVEVANPAGASDAVVRATFSPQIVSSDTTSQRTLYEFFNSGVIGAPVDNKVTLGTVTLHFVPGWDDPDNGWFFEDGFFYYNQVLEAGDTTPALLAGVTTSLAYQNIEVIVSVEALQAYPNQAARVWGVSIS